MDKSRSTVVLFWNQERLSRQAQLSVRHGSRGDWELLSPPDGQLLRLCAAAFAAFRSSAASSTAPPSPRPTAPIVLAAAASITASAASSPASLIVVRLTLPEARSSIASPVCCRLCSRLVTARSAPRAKRSSQRRKKPAVSPFDPLPFWRALRWVFTPQPPQGANPPQPALARAGVMRTSWLGFAFALALGEAHGYPPEVRAVPLASVGPAPEPSPAGSGIGHRSGRGPGYHFPAE